ncbi:MAG: DUF433 domain-containing protein [Acidobacteria bacterium]|nr:DUF433 domain-containing protein [Acidobacteriota bacterium]
MNATEVKLDHPYVEYHHGGYWVAGARVSLDSIVYRWREGLSAETIQKDCFPVLTLSHVFGALAYYLDHQAEIDEYLVRAEAEEEVIRQQLREAYPEAARRVDELAQRLSVAQNEDQVSSR